MATVAQAAAHIFLNERNFYELLERGVIERQEAGGYDLEIVREEYIRHLQRTAAGREKTQGKLDGEFERARKDKELADRTALQNAVTRGELVSVEAVKTAWIALIGNARERLLAMPNKLGARLAAISSATEVQSVIEDEVHTALAELAHTDVVALGPDGADAGGSDDEGGSGAVDAAAAADRF